MNVPTIIIGLVLIALIALAVRHLMKHGSCGCDCGDGCDCGTAASGSCCCCGTELPIDEINEKINESK